MTDAELARAAADNFTVHAAWVPGQLPDGRVRRDEGLVLVDAGWPCDTFNIICRARLGADADARIAEAVTFFGGRPFSWWVGPGDRPEDLGARLLRAGLHEAESEEAMALDLLTLLPPGDAPDGLQVRRVRSREALADFAGILAANWSPPDPWVLRHYDAAADALLAERSPQWFFVAVRDGATVGAIELTLGGGVVGVYNVSTLVAHRGAGIGTAMTWAALEAARRGGHHQAVLQAAPMGVGIYARLGFRPVGRITEYKPG